ncbi:hypothetical protein [Bdellovibrio sp. HCB2-146]|uniref:hypothetical protein n=1 Tax=Bdellovibrio sp. HCB2-146 TaxID=3394362 RepID=UPI0039BC7007
MENDDVPIIYREPAGVAGKKAPDDFLDGRARARLDMIVDNKTVKALSVSDNWYVGQILPVESQTEGIGIVAFVEVRHIERQLDGTIELTCELQRQSRLNFVQIGDQLFQLNLESENEKYLGTTDLLIRHRGATISSKYKPLFTQGIAVGETAETLWEKEYFVNYIAQVSYGVRDWLTIGTWVPGYFIQSGNAYFKSRFWQNNSNIFSGGLSFAKVQDKDSSSLNFNFYWDSISSDTVVGHTFITIALLSFEDAEDSTAIKSLGTSSLQSGYEYIRSNWDRVLAGPSYNFEKKAVGGYLTYLKIWDKFHASVSLNTVDISSMILSPTDGYFFTFDAYWRF